MVQAKIIDKNKKYIEPAKSKTRKDDLDKKGYPSGLKTRKSGPRKSYGFSKRKETALHEPVLQWKLKMGRIN